jgi:hypothetical protein
MLEYFPPDRALPRRDGDVRFGTLLGARTHGVGSRSASEPPAYTNPYVKRGKNDAADAEAMSKELDHCAANVTACSGHVFALEKTVWDFGLR